MSSTALSSMYLAVEFQENIMMALVRVSDSGEG